MLRPPRSSRGIPAEPLRPRDWNPAGVDALVTERCAPDPSQAERAATEWATCARHEPSGPQLDVGRRGRALGPQPRGCECEHCSRPTRQRELQRNPPPHREPDQRNSRMAQLVEGVADRRDPIAGEDSTRDRRGVAKAGKVDRDDLTLPSELRDHRVPDPARSGSAVNQQERWTITGPVVRQHAMPSVFRECSDGEAPDNVSMAAVALAISGGGALGSFESPQPTGGHDDLSVGETA
jgi:hypothetical protein